MQRRSRNLPHQAGLLIAVDYEDPYGTAVLLETRGVVKGYKQPKDLLFVSDVPMRVVTPSASRALAGRLFAGHPSLRWLCACFVAVHELRDKLSPKGLLWELIFPQDASGQPTKTASGKYHVKCFVMDEWRRVTVDCRIPVDAYGAPLLVGSMPAQLWPLILSKAILKLMALYQVLDRPSWHQVAAFQWLTGWPQENLMDPLHGPSIMGSGLFERLHEACKQDGAPAGGHSTAVAHLKVQDRDSLQRPQFLVLCCASGLPVDEVMQQLVAQHSDALGRTVTCTSRKPMEDEVQGQSYVFVPPASMQAGIEAGNFLETSEVNGLHGSGTFGVSYDGIRDVAATGSVGVFRVDLQGVQALQRKHAVDAVYVYLRPASMEDWAHAQSLRQVLAFNMLTESEATVQKRLAWAVQQSAAAAMPSLFSCTIQDASPDAAYDGLKHAVAALSPFVRNKLQGLPADVLDYADLIASSSVEQAILKPVVIAGPSVKRQEQLIQKLVEEFPQIFQAAVRHATPAYGQDAPSPGQPTASDPEVVVSTEEFKRLEGQGELVEQHSDPFTHVLARQHHGVTKGSIAAVVAASKIPLLLTDVEGVQKAKADGLDCLSIFLAPASPQAFEAETREWLQRPQEALDAQIAAVNADWDTAQSSTLFDNKLVFNNVEQTCDELTQILTRHRPDLIHSREGSDSSSPPAGPQLPGPLVICSVAGPARETLITKLMQDYPSKFGTAI
ncbi:MAG: guanylate kinase, partial [Trebouxia sp. A1-2]